MKIDILYFEGCPNHRPVVEMARRLVAEHGLDASVEECEVAPGEEARLRFLGSPTVRVDGVDIEPAARERTDYAMSCRVYNSPDGLPSEELLLAAIDVDSTTGRVPSRDRANLMAMGGSVVAAALSSACCWLPLLLLASGATAAGASAFFERWRPVFVAVAVLMLGAGFYSVYLRPRACCDAGACGAKRGVGAQVSLWLSAVMVGALVTFPTWGRTLIADGQPKAGEATLEAAGQVVSLKVEGMTCELCADRLARGLRNVPGVLDASADWARGTARVVTKSKAPAVATLARAVEEAGYAIVESEVEKGDQTDSGS